MFRRWTVVLILLLVASPVGADEVDPEPPGASKAILGTWELVRVIGMGQGPTPPGLTLKFEKDKVSVSLMGKDAGKIHTFKIDPRKKPPHIQLIDGKGNRTIDGIYKIEKGELFLCIGERSGKRPTSFDGKTDAVLVLKKPKK